MTPERIEQERMAFEAWMVELYPTNPQTERVGDEYSRLGTQYKWEGWQAKAAQSEWISVEDSLPEDDPNLMSKGSLGTNQRYFIYPNPLSKFSPVVPAVMTAYRCLDQKTGEYVWGDSMMYPSLSVQNITHWQPIKSPAPPHIPDHIQRGGTRGKS
ncbi:MAG: DUF551 domain-containing protein [Eikenella corrodens]